MPTNEERDRAKKGIKARQDAVKWLIEENREAFEERVRKNRIALGLSPRPAGATAAQLEAKIKRAREQMERWQQELAEAS